MHLKFLKVGNSGIRIMFGNYSVSCHLSRNITQPAANSKQVIVKKLLADHTYKEYTLGIH